MLNSISNNLSGVIEVMRIIVIRSYNYTFNQNLPIERLPEDVSIIINKIDPSLPSQISKGLDEGNSMINNVVDNVMVDNIKHIDNIVPNSLRHSYSKPGLPSRKGDIALALDDYDKVEH